MRHGLTNENKAQIYIGHNDPPLNVDAIEEINQIQPYVAVPDIIYSSDLTRAEETAKTLFPNSKIHILSQLRERHFGSLQGKSRSLVQGLNLYSKENDELNQDYYGVESFSSIKSRVNYVLNVIKESEANRILILSHGAFLSYFVNILLSEDFIMHPLKNLHYHKIVLDDQGNVVEVKFNQNWLLKEKDQN